MTIVNIFKHANYENEYLEVVFIYFININFAIVICNLFVIYTIF